MTTVAIVGAGLVGRGWAFVFARAGMAVRVWDAEPAVLERLPAEIAKMAAEAGAFGCGGSDHAGLADRILTFASLDEALRGASLVQESGPEVLSVKQALFTRLDELAEPDAVVASSSSGLTVSQYTDELPGRHRCLVGHPVNPPHLVPVVELSPGPHTDAATLDTAERIYRQAGQVPVRLEREIDGFILNRLQAVVLAEALRLVDEGYVSAHGLDDTMRHGLGRRWAFMGPLETISLNAPNGIADYLRRYGPTMARLADDAARGEAFNEAAIEKVARAFPVTESDKVRARQAWRDDELAALARHLAERNARHAEGEGRHGGQA